MFDTYSEKKFLLKQLVKRDLTSKYKDSVLGIAWSFLNPLLIMIVFTAIFSMLFGRQIENYPVYFLSGRVIYDFFKSGTGGAMKSIKGNERCAYHRDSFTAQRVYHACGHDTGAG